MFTVCPKCALTLVVTAPDLRVAQGYVRCGRCSNVFNAIVGLSDDRQAKAAQAAARRGTSRPARRPHRHPGRHRLRRPPAPTPEPENGTDLRTTTATTGENEAIYAEPEPLDVISEHGARIQSDLTDVSKVFVEPPAVGEGDPTGPSRRSCSGGRRE